MALTVDETVRKYIYLFAEYYRFLYTTNDNEYQFLYCKGVINMSEMFPLSQIIKQRRSVRQFKTDPVSVDLIRELLDIAVWAPTHGMREPWRFIVFADEGKRVLAEAIAKYGKKARDPEILMQIPLYLMVVMKEDPRQREWEEDYAAVSTCIQNFQLAAWERGLGVVWKTGPVILQPEFRESIGVKPGEKLVGMLQVGYPEVIPDPKPRTPADNKLTIIRSVQDMKDL